MAQTSQDESKDASSPEAVILPKQDKKFAPFNVLFFFVNQKNVTLSQKFKRKRNKIRERKRKPPQSLSGLILMSSTGSVRAST